jgi:hypothetical protein
MFFMKVVHDGRVDEGVGNAWRGDISVARQSYSRRLAAGDFFRATYSLPRIAKIVRGRLLQKENSH